MARPENLKQSVPGLARFFRHFWPTLRKYRRLLALSLLVLVAEVFLRLLEPWPISFVIDRVIAPPATPGPAATLALEGLSATSLLTLAAIAVVAFTGLRALSRYLSAVGFALIGNRFMTEVRDDLYRHLQRLSISFHGKSRSGDLIIRVIGDVGMVREVVVTALMPLLGNVLILAGMLAVMFWMHWQLTLAALTTAPLFGLVNLKLGRRIREVSKKQRRSEGHMASTAAESLAAIETVQALSLGDAFSDSFSGQSKKSLKEGVKGKRLSAQLERTADVLSALAQAIVLWYGSHIVLRGELTAGELLVFISYLRGAFRPVRNFAKYSARLAKASAAGERVLQVLEQEPEVVDRPDAVDAPPFATALRFEGVHYGYEPDHPVLHDIDFEIPKGKRVALVGHSGSGKSTLVGLCLRLFDPNRGRVCLDGQDLRDLRVDSLRSQITVVLQDTLLFASSVADNIAAGSPDADREQVEAAARRIGADAFIRQLPEGYDTQVGERGVTLSRGQRQRIAVARAAVRSAPILILDEPISGLDEENQRILLEALEQLSADRTVLLVTHELAHAMSFDTILFVEAGRVVERGSHAELMAQGGRYAALYRMQTQAEGEAGDGQHAVGR